MQRMRAKDRLILNLKDRDAESQRQGQRNRDRKMGSKKTERETAK